MSWYVVRAVLVASALVWLRSQQAGAPAWERAAVRLFLVALGARVGSMLAVLLPKL